MPLNPGHFFSFDDAGLKALRARKGDRARREHVSGLVRAPGSCRLLSIGEAWAWAKWLIGREVFRGKSLHRGSMGHIEVLSTDAVSAALARLPNERAALERAFLGIDEAAFRYSMVPFWVTNEWQRDGVTQLLTAERAARVAQAIAELRVFVDEVIGAGHHLVLFEDYRL